MDAVVMAAGEGRRLRPLTERWPKPILPIEGRPVVATLLHELRTAEFEEVWLVVGHLRARVESLLGDGNAFGLRIRYVVQPRQDGSADAVACALRAGARPPLLVTAADTVYRPHDLARAREEWQAAGTAGGLGVRPLAPPELRHQTRVQVEAGRVTELRGAAAVAQDDPMLTAAPLWFLGPSIVSRLDSLSGPPYELAEAALDAIAAGEEVTALELGPTRDLTSPDDLVRRNFAYLWT
jgi:NDP-sugar pyrophosphorylase family protein